MTPEPQWSQDLNIHRGLSLPGEITYNSGVVVYDHDSPVLKVWLEQTPKRTHLFLGDQQLLSRILFTHAWKFNDLPQPFNWFLLSELDRRALIVHWAGTTKQAMETLLKSLEEHFLINLSFEDP